MKINQTALAGALAMSLALSANAAWSADNAFHVGVANINVRSQSPDLTSNGPAFLTPQPAGITVGDATTLVFGYTRRLTDHWDFDVLLGVPPTHSISGTGKLAPFGEIARIKQAGPTFMFNYHFGDEGSSFRPFIGGGVNFTRFYDATSTASGDIASGGPTKISLTDSMGPAAQVGMTYRFNAQWSLNAAIATAKVKTNMTTLTGSIERKTVVDLRPVVISTGLAYAF